MLLSTVSDTLAAEKALFARLEGDKEIPPFDKPVPVQPDYSQWQQPIDGRIQSLPSASDESDADKAFRAATHREELVRAATAQQMKNQFGAA
jgi:hypothetical protein